MSRRAIALAVLSLAAVVIIAACQNYNFSPVGSCLIQPGSKQVTLTDLTTADILFVVDDSGSMDSKQQALASNFNTFISNLNAANADRVSRGLQPFDFHIAITTSSIFAADSTGKQCVLNGGNTQCCSISNCTTVSSCVPGSTSGCSSGTCTFARSAIAAGTYPPVTNVYQCCSVNVSSCVNAPCFPGDACPAYTTSYTSFSGCTQGVAQLGPYPSGSLVAAQGNRKVLHFTKDLYTTNPPNTTAINALVAQFQQNIQAGSCGSGEEQHLEAGRLAMQKLLGGSQSGVTSSDWPHLGAKLIVVFVGDEDDCSSPTDPSKSIVLIHGADVGADECVADKNIPAQNQTQSIPAQNQIPQRAFPVADYDTYFSSLVMAAGQQPTAAQPYRSLGAAFIDASLKCTNPQSSYPLPYAPADESYLKTPPDNPPGAGNACIEPPTFGCSGTSPAFAAGVRHLDLAQRLITRGYSVVLGAVCDNFGQILSNVADLVKAPSALQLDSTPASTDITVVRIVDANGNQRLVCTEAKTAADTATAGWWFINCADKNNPPAVATGTTTCIFINHASGTCEASPGETYSAEYLGIIPPGGCTPASATKPTSGSPTAGQTACATALGGDPNTWWCYAASGTTGTCLCNQ